MSADSVFRRLFRRETHHGPAGLERGAIFSSHAPGRAAELAQVIGVRRDEFGIGHVHFRLFFQYQDKVQDAGDRTLAVAAFRQRFTQRRDDAQPR
jgi:hypothetical protein